MRIEVSDGLKDSLNDGMVAAFEHWLSDKLPQEGKALINAYATHQSVLGEPIDPSLPNTSEALCYYEYVHDDAPYDKQFIREVTSNIETLNTRHYFELIDILNARIERQFDCVHDYAKPCDPEGATYPDGRGVCTKCGLKNRYAFLPVEGTLIKMSSGPEFVSRYPWPDGMYIQGGTYRERDNKPKSAFIEAFPDVNGIGTFLRADAPTVREAEAYAYSQYQKRMACEEHQWTRDIDGRHRTDGYAKCTKCGLQGKALVPETVCVVCETPTSHNSLGEYRCLRHYMDIPAVERAEKLTYEAVHRGGAFFRETKEKQWYWHYFVVETLKDSILSVMPWEQFESCQKEVSRLSHYGAQVIVNQRYQQKGIASISGHPYAKTTPEKGTTDFEDDVAVVDAMKTTFARVVKQRVDGEIDKIRGSDLFTDAVKAVSNSRPLPEYNENDE